MNKTKKSPKADLENKRNMFFLIGLVSALCFVLYAFEWKTTKTTTIPDLGKSDFVPEQYVFIPRTFDKPEVAKQVIKAPNIVIVDNNKDVDLNMDIFKDDPSEPTPIDLTVFSDIPEEKDDATIDKVIDYAEIMPEFPGGSKALLSYLSKNVKYPVIAQQNGIQDKVYVSFIVDEKGNIYNAFIARGSDIHLNNEALRVVNSMPKWKPGMQGGKTVKVRYTVPINFILK